MKKARYDSMVSKVFNYKEIRMKLRNKFLESNAKPIAELFCNIPNIFGCFLDWYTTCNLYYKNISHWTKN